MSHNEKKRVAYMADEQNKKDETIYDRWEQSCYTYVGNVFDTPEHQEALAKLPTLKEKVAYKTAVMKERQRKLLGHD